MRYAITDIGSNTVKISVYDVNERILHLFSHSITLGLDTYRSENELTEAGIIALANAITEHKNLAMAVACDRISCLATASLRSLANTDDVIERVRRLTGLTIEIISGEREAELAFAGLCSIVTHPADGILLDMGGASTEIITIRQQKPIAISSLDFGALKLYHHYVSALIPNAKESLHIQCHVANELATHFAVSTTTSQTAYLTGGTAKALCKLLCLNDPTKERSCFSVDELYGLRDRLCDNGFLHKAASRIPERIHMIIPGTIAILEILRHFEIQRIEIVRSGIRDGYIFERSQ